MLKLKQRDLPEVQFRRELPAYLGPDDVDECFIHIEARAAGSVNPKYATLREQLFNKARVWDRQTEKYAQDNPDDHESVVQRDADNRKKAAKARLAALYDACVISWECNILNGDAQIECNRDNFLALTEVKGVPEITAALMEFETECLNAGKLQAKADEDERGN